MQVFSRYSFQKPQSKEMANGFITVTPTHQYWVRFLFLLQRRHVISKWDLFLATLLRYTTSNCVESTFLIANHFRKVCFKLSTKITSSNFILQRFFLRIKMINRRYCYSVTGSFSLLNAQYAVEIRVEGTATNKICLCFTGTRCICSRPPNSIYALPRFTWGLLRIRVVLNHNLNQSRLTYGAAFLN